MRRLAVAALVAVAAGCGGSTNGRGSLPRVVPTATQKRGELHDTPESTFVTLGSPLETTCHDRPSHDSISAWPPAAVK